MRGDPVPSAVAWKKALAPRRCPAGRWAGVLAAGLATALLAACISYGEAGDRAAAAGNWDQAVLNYERAFDQEPQNPGLGRKLSEAKRNAARVHREQASELRSAGQLQQAIDEFLVSLRYEADPAVEALLEQTRQEKRRADAERALTDAAVAAREGRLVDAVGLYEQAAELNPALRSASERALGEVRDRIRRAEQTARQAEQALDRGDLDRAGQLAAQALEINPQDALASDVASAARNEREAARAEQRAREALRDREYDRAVDNAREAVSLRETPVRTRLLDEIEEDAFEEYRARARAAARRDRFDAAVELYELAIEYGGDDRGLGPELSDARYSLALSRGEDAESRGAYRDALAYYREAATYRPTTEVENRIRALSYRDDYARQSGAGAGAVVLIRGSSDPVVGVAVGRGAILSNVGALSDRRARIFGRGEQTGIERTRRHPSADIAVGTTDRELAGGTALLGRGFRLRTGERIAVITLNSDSEFIEANCQVIGPPERLNGRTQVVPLRGPEALPGRSGIAFDQRGEVVGILARGRGPEKDIVYMIPIEYAFDLL